MIERVLEQIIKGLVTMPDDIFVRVHRFHSSNKYKIIVHKDDVPRVIGKGGHVIQAIKTVVCALDPDKKISIDVDSIKESFIQQD